MSSPENAKKVKTCKDYEAALVASFNKLFGGTPLKDLDWDDLRAGPEWESHFMTCHGCSSDAMRGYLKTADPPTKGCLMTMFVVGRRQGLSRQAIEDLWRPWVRGLTH